MIEPFKSVKGLVIPLNMADIDTDQIIPAIHLKRIKRTGFGRYAFELWKQYPDFVLNNAKYKNAPVMVTGPNFGCGSSREHAPWALSDMGIKVIIAPSFADIFKNNCVESGILTVEVESQICTDLIKRAQKDSLVLSVDLKKEIVKIPNEDFQIRFKVDPFTKYRLLNGLDSIDLTLKNENSISRYESLINPFMPTMEQLHEKI